MSGQSSVAAGKWLLSLEKPLTFGGELLEALAWDQVVGMCSDLDCKFNLSFLFLSTINLCYIPTGKSAFFFFLVFVSLIPWREAALCIISLEDSVYDLHIPVEPEWTYYLLLDISR